MKETAYLLQAALVALWWVGLALSQRFFDAFQFPGMDAKAFWAFFIPDIIVIAGLSLVRAYNRSRTLEWIILGGFAYASLYCINASILTLGGWLPSLLMVCGLAYNGLLCFNRSAFRESQSRSVYANGIKTLLQIVCIWILSLVVVPYVIMDAFGDVKIPNVDARLIVGLLLLVVFSLLGLSSSYVMVRQGQGTPLPLDQTNQLVTRGPYRFVRNPMAVAGIGQGVCVSLIFWSLPILVYSLLGAVIWHVVVRPIEEKNLQSRFGQRYLDYRQAVRCWIPRWRTI